MVTIVWQAIAAVLDQGFNGPLRSNWHPTGWSGTNTDPIPKLPKLH